MVDVHQDAIESSVTICLQSMTKELTHWSKCIACSERSPQGEAHSLARLA